MKEKIMEGVFSPMVHKKVRIGNNMKGYLSFGFKIVKLI
jgi:hypothetical protein